MRYIDDAQLTNKRILLRVDYNIAFTKNHHIANDERIRQSIPTIEYLLKHHNYPILLSHLGRPHGVEKALSLEPIAHRLQELLPHASVRFMPDFTSLLMENTRIPHKNELILCENIRFYDGEDNNDPAFTKELAKLGDVFVNDAFSVSHRASASVVGLTKVLPSYGGLLLKKEVEMIGKAITNPKHPFVAILGGAKISTKIKLINKLITHADFLLLGGGIANTFLLALGNEMGRSLVEKGEIDEAKRLLNHAARERTKLLLPTDAVIGGKDGQHVAIKSVHTLTKHDAIFDIGPETQAVFAQAILQAKTVIWNGPVGQFEVESYQRGTDFIYYAIISNPEATSIVGGGETLAAIADKENRERITHISTGGGAMLEFIENGTLPGIEALKENRL